MHVVNVMSATLRAVVVEARCGKLRGCIQRSCLGDDYCAFKGVPYAKPPLGPLRFRDPEPLQPWSDVRDATKYSPRSLQVPFEKPGQLIGSEDCLYLNVYARKIDVSLRRPVIVYIHGGAFVKNSGDDTYCGPDYFMSKDDIVLVTFNYRLGVFGFLNLEDEVAPGNQGLKDQVLALQWVKDNISHFGGDPGNVTICGGSAGAASVHYLALSPLAKGLFHKAICQSGSVLNPWAVKHDPQKSLDEFLPLLGFNKSRDPKTVVEFLRTVESHKLAEAQEKLITAETLLKCNFPFGPCVDDKSSKPFTPVDVAILAEKGIQVPLMVGSNSFEGIYFQHFIKALDIKEIERDFDKYIIRWLRDILKRYDLTLETFRKLYFKRYTISEQNLTKFLEFYSEVGFVEGVQKLVGIQVLKSGAPTYFYKFSYYKDTDTPYKGACHGDEVNYEFKVKRFEENNIPQLEEGTSDVRIMKQIIELWTNFAKTGRPTPTTSDLIPVHWLPVVNDEVLRYLNIDEELRMEKEINMGQCFSSFKTPP